MPASPALAGISVSWSTRVLYWPPRVRGIRVSTASADKVRLNGGGFGDFPR